MYKQPVPRDPKKMWSTIAYRNVTSGHSFRQGMAFGESLAKRKIYTRDDLIKLIHTMRLASNQDRAAYKLGVLMGYMEEAKRLNFYDKEDEVMEADMVKLGIVS